MDTAYPNFTCERCGISATAKTRARKPRFCTRRCANERRADDFAGRLWARIDRSGGASSCWPWLGARDKDGYGKTHDHRLGDIRAHRAVFMIEFGELPILVRHSCDNPPCCNPAHLLAGTLDDNRSDMMERGRQCRGERVRTAKMSEAGVLRARRLHHHGVSVNELMAQFNLGKSSMHALLKGQTWRHLPLEDPLQ